MHIENVRDDPCYSYLLYLGGRTACFGHKILTDTAGSVVTADKNNDVSKKYRNWGLQELQVQVLGLSSAREGLAGKEWGEQ